MEFESQKPSSAQYRDNWERIWGRLWSDPAEKPLTYDDIDPPEPTYANGCPVLSNE